MLQEKAALLIQHGWTVYPDNWNEDLEYFTLTQLPRLTACAVDRPGFLNSLFPAQIRTAGDSTGQKRKENCIKVDQWGQHDKPKNKRVKESYTEPSLPEPWKLIRRTEGEGVKGPENLVK